VSISVSQAWVRSRCLTRKNTASENEFLAQLPLLNQNPAETKKNNCTKADQHFHSFTIEQNRAFSVFRPFEMISIR
jgi:hypothetical protein